MVVLLEPPVTRRADRGNWELAMENVLKAFRDVEIENQRLVSTTIALLSHRVL